MIWRALSSPAEFRHLLSGQRRGISAGLLRQAFRVAEVPYGVAIRLRNWAYDRGWARVHRVAAPVISVGNLTLGGTGKTPMVEWLARWLRAKNLRVSIISRGYGARSGAQNDETLALRQMLPDVALLQNPDRVEAAYRAIEQFGCQAVLLDDGFQHRRIGRDLDIVMLDALAPFGYGHLLPRGMLREPLAALRRAHVLVLSRADTTTLDQRQHIRRRLEHVAPHAVFAETRHRPDHLRCADGSRYPMERLRDQPVAAFCGIGNPASFLHSLKQCGYDVAGFREFPDHHPYAREDLAALEHWVRNLAVAAVLCTHKDLVKLPHAALGGRPLYALAISLEFLAGQEELEEKLGQVMAHWAASHPSGT